MRIITISFVFIILLCSCGDKHRKIDYNNQTANDSILMDSIVSDTTKILVAELPVYFDSTDYLIFPIGLLTLDSRGAKRITRFGSYSSSDYSNSGLMVNSFRDDYFSGNITNLVFENLKDGEQYLLTERALNITYVQYLRELSKRIKRQYILYSVIDNDLNHDGELNHYDISALYISQINGKDFKKLTNPFHQYNDGKLILQELRYYYRTIEDINRDGEFNKEDKLHYYYLDFSGSGFKNIEYNPLKLIIK